MFKEGDKVTAVSNPQCHGTVLQSDEKTTTVKLDNFSVPTSLQTAELKLRGTNAVAQK